MPTTDLDLLCINTVRTLAMDAVQQAESGHPGTPMALAPLAYALFTKHMRHDPADPTWPNHMPVMRAAGLQIREYPYFDAASGTVRFDDMLAALYALVVFAIGQRVIG